MEKKRDMKKIWFYVILFAIVLLAIVVLLDKAGITGNAIIFDTFSISECGAATTAGVYTLNQSFTDSREDDAVGCIEVNVSDVTIDCQWNLITGTGQYGYGMWINPTGASQITNITIVNCDFFNFGWNMGFDNVADSSFTNIISRGGYTADLKVANVDTSTFQNITTFNTGGDFDVAANVLLITGSEFNMFKDINATEGGYSIPISSADTNNGNSYFQNIYFICGTSGCTIGFDFNGADNLNNTVYNGLVDFRPSGHQPITIRGGAVANVSNFTFYGNTNGISSLTGAGAGTRVYNNIFNGSNYFENSGSELYNITLTSGTNIFGGANIGGNYWTNSTGAGFSDICTDANSNGICDSMMNVSNNIDYLPLSNVTGAVDSASPNLEMTYPTNTTYNATITTMNYTAVDDNLDICWYSLDSGTTNITVSCGTNATGLSASEGNNTWRVYANDSSGNENMSQIIFTIDTTAPTISFSCTPLEVTQNAVITCTCSASDTWDSSPSVTYTANPSTADTGEYSTTCTAVDASNNSASSSVTYNVIGSEDSGDGGSSGSGDDGTTTPGEEGDTDDGTTTDNSDTGSDDNDNDDITGEDIEELPGLEDIEDYSWKETVEEHLTEDFEEIKSITEEFSEEKRVKITIKNKNNIRETHTVGVLEIYENKNQVRIVIASTPVEIILGIGETKKIDLTKDNFYDLKVRLDDIIGGNAILSIDYIQEEVPQGFTKSNLNTLSYRNIAIIIAAIILALVIFIIIRKRELDKVSGPRKGKRVSRLRGKAKDKSKRN